MEWWSTTMSYVLKCMLLSVLIQSLIIMVASTRSECNQTRFEEECGHPDIQQRLKYLSNEIVRTKPKINCASRRWFHSPDDRPHCTPLNSSSSKYLIQNDHLSLNLSNVSASDEGIYGCLCSGNNRTNSICVKVYGKAVFASCPHELTCTENETLTLPASGGSVSFNATVIYVHGGNCGYRQNISLIKLRKISGGTKPLYICKPNERPCLPDEGNVSFSSGNSGFEFILTLFNVTADSIGTYEVIVETINPHTGSYMPQQKKIYHVVARSTPSTPTPSPSSPALTKSMTITTSPTVTNTLPRTQTPLAVIIGVPAGAFVVIVIIAIIAVIILVCSRKKVACQSSNEGSNSSIPIYPQIEQNQSMRYNTLTMTIAHNHNIRNEGTLTQAPDSETSTGQIMLPPPYDTMSTNGEIELSDGQMNSNTEIV